MVIVLLFVHLPLWPNSIKTYMKYYIQNTFQVESAFLSAGRSKGYSPHISPFIRKGGGGGGGCLGGNDYKWLVHNQVTEAGKIILMHLQIQPNFWLDSIKQYCYRFCNLVFYCWEFQICYEQIKYSISWLLFLPAEPTGWWASSTNA